jgi:hypothetical protein
MLTHRITVRELALHGVLLLVLVAFAFPGTFLRGEVITSAALLLTSPPWQDYQPEGYTPPLNWLATDSIIVNSWLLLSQRAIDNGEWPLWNHLQLMGTPLLANYQARALYPLRLPFCLFDYLTALTLFHLLRMWLCGFTAYLCGRTHEMGIGVSRFLSVGWMLSSYILTWFYWPIPDVAAWLPVLFIGVESLLRGRYRRGFFTLAAGATCLLLAGHPETAFTTGLGVGIYFFVRLIYRRSKACGIIRALLLAGGAWMVALLVCSAQLLPFLEYIPESYDADKRAHKETSDHSIPTGEIAALWVPRFYGVTALDNFRGAVHSNFTMLVYAGIVTWIAAFLVAVRRERSPSSTARITALALPCIFFLLMAFNVPLTASVKKLPLFNLMWHLYYASFAVFALVFLAATGLEKWFSKRRTPRELLPILPGIALIAVIVAAPFLVNRPSLDTDGETGYVLHQMLLAGILAAAACAFLLAHCAWRKPRVLIAALTLLLAADLLIAQRGLRPTAPREQLFPRTDFTDALTGQDEPIRLSLLTAQLPLPAKTGLMPIFGVEELYGYDGIYPSRPLRFLGECNKRAWNTMEPVCAVNRYAFRPDAFAPGEQPKRYELLDTLNGLSIYRNKRAFPRVFLVGNLRVVDDADAVFDTICAPGFNPARTVVTDQPPQQTPPTADTTELGSARLRKRDATRVTIDVQAKHECVLVLADAYYPGWHAFVDEEPTEIFPAYHAMRGIIIPAGDHTVEFRYRPGSFRLGLAVSTMTLIAGALAALILLLRSPIRRSA